MSLHIENLSFSYGKSPVLTDISFRAEYGEILSILGPNGAGKSTLFRCILGLLRPDSGTVTLDGQDILAMKPSRLARHIAYIPQSHDPVFPYSVTDMVLMGTTAHMGSFASPGKQQHTLAMDALTRLGIEKLKDRSFPSLSGGERQLVLIARAMAQQAKVLVMDEPSASLDFGNRMMLMDTVKSLADHGYAIIQSTHDPDQAYRHSHKILALRQGQILAWGKPEAVITSQTVSALYGRKIHVQSLQNDKLRICINNEQEESL